MGPLSDPGVGGSEFLHRRYTEIEIQEYMLLYIPVKSTTEFREPNLIAVGTGVGGQSRV